MLLPGSGEAPLRAKLTPQALLCPQHSPNQGCQTPALKPGSCLRPISTGRATSCSRDRGDVAALCHHRHFCAETQTYLWRRLGVTQGGESPFLFLLLLLQEQLSSSSSPLAGTFRKRVTGLEWVCDLIIVELWPDWSLQHHCVPSLHLFEALKPPW